MKESKLQARYQEHPKGAQRCDHCTMYRRPNGCTVVIGHISPAGWCKHFERKQEG